MERIVKIPDGITASLAGKTLIVKGPKGELSREFRSPTASISMKDGSVIISYKSVKKEKSGKQVPVARKKVHALGGTWESHIGNMFTGVEKGWEAKLKIIYSHFPIKVSVEGNKVAVGNFLGERGQKKTSIKGNAKVEVKKDEIVITGISREDVGQTAANIELLSKVKGFDKRVFQDGCHLVQKAKPIGEE